MNPIQSLDRVQFPSTCAALLRIFQICLLSGISRRCASEWLRTVIIVGHTAHRVGERDDDKRNEIPQISSTASARVGPSSPCRRSPHTAHPLLAR